MHSTAVDKAVLAEMTDEKMVDILDLHGMPSKTPATVTDLEELLDAIDAVRERGYARDVQEDISVSAMSRW
ncbi:IclR family transcriptional regulator domain-containing protein [Haladaptatus caseinilyticus]|uniref:IclR family transcriptional regulator domain-containing protein n=1 Tax=Haladaptatus caseinilyticus TaxID=2993314 RepID=UPI00224B8C24|nr:IclR family transcriptional regulator C-terminal domain-containing protein [Haladaptatus caseinilyticus]